MLQYNDVRLGSIHVDKVYSGNDLIYEYTLDTTAPITSPRPYDALNNPTNTFSSPQTVYLDVNEMGDTYYSLDGSNPTIKYIGDGLYIDTTTTIKYYTVDTSGNAETVKTLTYNITVSQPPTTTISPTSTTQNTIPITVTLTSSEQGAAIYYKLGTSPTVNTYTAPFSVNQSTAYVQSTQIKVTYWSVGANGTEAEKSITYDTLGATPAAPVVNAVAGNNQVALSWAATANTTSYTVYRSTASGTLGTILTGTQWMTGTSWNDTTAVNGTTYYYTVQAGNYGNPTNSAQKAATPVAAPSGWRYLKILGYGALEVGQEGTTRIIEFEAWEGATNRMTAATLTGEAPSNVGTGGTLAQIKDGVKGYTSNTYPYWWTTKPNANVVIDLGAQYPLTKLNYYGYSISGGQRTNCFSVLASNTNNGSDWVTLWDNSTGQAGVQGILPAGYEKAL